MELSEALGISLIIMLLSFFVILHNYAQTWTDTPLFERKQGNLAALLNLEDRKERIAKRYGVISSDGEKIRKCVQVNRK